MLLTDPTPCAVGPAQQACETGGSSGVTTPADSLDPLTAFAHSTAKAADWTARQLGKVVGNRDAVDFTNASFLQQYAVVFAASAVLVLMLWLLAVAKRAVRGVPLTTAMSEAVGGLWLAVMASAFTPLILYTLINAVSAVTDVLSSALGSQTGGVFASLGGNLKDGKIGGGPVILIAASFATILLCGALWLLLVLRALGLYVGALLGVIVYAGLVDKDLWGHVRRWAGFMVVLVLAEPVIVIILGLAAALQSAGQHGPVATGLAVTGATLGVTVYIITKTPGFGDAMRVARVTARAGVGTARTVIGPSAPASTGVLNGIQTHADRNRSTTGGAQTKPSNQLSGGISAHGQRNSRQQGDNNAE